MCSKIDAEIMKNLIDYKRSIKNPPKSVKNLSQVGEKSMKMWFWTVVGRRSRPGRHQEGHQDSGDSVFAAFLAENVAPRVDFGTPGNSKIGKKSHFCVKVGAWTLQKWVLFSIYVRT